MSENQAKGSSLSQTREIFNFTAPFLTIAAAELAALDLVNAQVAELGSIFPLIAGGMVIIDLLASVGIAEQLDRRYLSKHR